MAKHSLEKLIESLTQGELRAFSLSIKQNNNPTYYKLFNDIKSGKISKKKDNTNTQLRNYLYNSLLDSLTKGAKTIDVQISTKLHKAGILYHKLLFKESWNEINKAEKLAVERERFGYIIQILEWKKAIGLKLEKFTTYDFKNVTQIEKKTIAQYLEYLQAVDAYKELLFYKKKRGYNYELNSSEFEALPSSSSEIPKRTLFYIRMRAAVHYCLIQDTKRQYAITKDILETDNFTIEPRECIDAIFEHLTSCICIGAFRELIPTLELLRDVIDRNNMESDPEISLKLFYYSANYEIMAYTYLGEEKDLETKMKETQRGLIKFEKNLSKEIIFLISSALAMGYFFMGKIREAKKYINDILSNQTAGIRIDIYQATLFFSIMIAHERNNIRTMAADLKQLRNQFDVHQYPFEKDMYDIFLDFSIGKLNKEEVYPLILASYRNTTKLPSNRLDYNEKYYPYYLWAQAHQNNTTVIETAKSFS